MSTSVICFIGNFVFIFQGLFVCFFFAFGFIPFFFNVSNMFFKNVSVILSVFRYEMHAYFFGEYFFAFGVSKAKKLIEYFYEHDSYCIGSDFVS